MHGKNEDKRMKFKEYEVLGIKSYESAKTKKVGTIIHYVTPFADNENETSKRLSGMQVGQEFTYLPIADDIHVGDLVKFSYSKSGFDGRAVLDDIIIVKPAPAPATK